MAPAVMATIGKWSPVDFSLSRIAPVASSPHLRHLHIHEDEVKILPFHGGKRFIASAGHSNYVPMFFQHADRHPLVNLIVLGQQNSHSISWLAQTEWNGQRGFLFLFERTQGLSDGDQ
jgi:hypothetical protein